MSEIIKNKLYLGDMFDANNETAIKERNINCIICVAEGLRIICNDPSIKIYRYDFQDDYKCDISVFFDEIGEIINNEKIVLVNCAAGISRSSSVVLAYIMKYHKLTLIDAFQYVRSKRHQICPNKQFMNYLLDYELQLYGQNSITLQQCKEMFYYT